MEAVIVDDAKTAQECIQYMREQRVGVATFIPLDSIRVKPIAERLRRLDRAARLAIDCVKYNCTLSLFHSFTPSLFFFFRFSLLNSFVCS